MLEIIQEKDKEQKIRDLMDKIGDMDLQKAYKEKMKKILGDYTEFFLIHLDDENLDIDQLIHDFVEESFIVEEDEQS